MSTVMYSASLYRYFVRLEIRLGPKLLRDVANSANADNQFHPSAPLFTIANFTCKYNMPSADPFDSALYVIT